MTVPIDVAISLDGSRGVAVVEVDDVVGTLRLTERGLGGQVIHTPNADEGTRVRILIDAVWYATDKAPNREGPRLELEAGLPAFFTFVLGEWLDTDGLRIFGGDTILEASPAVWNAYERTPAKARDIETYVAGKITWAYEFGLSPVAFGVADSRRLKVSFERINEVASACAGESWSIVESDPVRFRLTRPLGGAAPLTAGRIQWRASDDMARKGMEKSLELLSKGDLENAVKEAVASLETIALESAGLSKGTLGDAIKELRQKGIVPRPMDKTLEAVWGFSSSQSGIRHRSGDGRLDRATAIYVIDSAAAAVAFLVGRLRDTA